MKLPLVALLSALSLRSAAGEGDVHVCACEAVEFGFAIDCDATDVMLGALADLGTLGCATECTSAECEKAYLIVQSHHDYCPEEGIPEEIEDGFHDYDESCKACEISRAFTAGAPDCPPAICDDASGNDAYAAMVTAGCQSDCSSDQCRDDFLTLRVTHDGCDHDTLSQAAEEGLHDMEKSCAGQVCNSVAGAAQQLVCDEDHSDHDDHSSHDDHGDGDVDVHVCACEAEEFGFDIDCSKKGVMLDALQSLQTLGCATECTSAECERAYLIVQSHHDYCPEEGIPQEIEDGFHDYDEACKACEIGRAYVDGLPDCPTANCDDNSGNDAYTAMATADCGSDCSSQACRDDFLTLRVIHDDCEHDTLSRASEEGLHDMEESCPGQACNSVGAAAEQLVCEDDHAGHDHGDGDEDKTPEGPTPASPTPAGPTPGGQASDKVADAPTESGAAAPAVAGLAAVLIGVAMVIV